MRMRPTCVFTVGIAMNSSSAISALVRPSAMSRRISSSRCVNGSGRSSRVCAAPVGASGAPSCDASIGRTCAMSLAADRADKAESPAATSRMAASSSSGAASLSRNPDAPAAMASVTYSSTSKVVRTRIRGALPSLCVDPFPRSARLPRIRLVASIPSTPGMRMSMRITSGASAALISIAASPSSACQVTSMSSWESTTIAKPARTSIWSSASATRITPSPLASSAIPRAS